MMKKKMTAAELMARLNADPHHVARKRTRDEEFQRKEQEYAHAEAPLLQELNSAGVLVDSVWDFVNGKVGTGLRAKAIPILLHHLQHPYPDAIRDGIARAMAIPAAKFAWPVLVKLYRQEHGKRTKGGLAVAIANAADGETIGEVIELARNPRNGESRLLLLDALERSRLPEARKALMELGGDPELHKEVQRILRRLKRTKR